MNRNRGHHPGRHCLYNALDPAADESSAAIGSGWICAAKSKRFYPYKGTHLQMNILHLQLSGGPGGIVSLCRDINKHSAHHNFFYFLFEGGSIADEIAAQGGTVQVATGAKNHPLRRPPTWCATAKNSKLMW